MHATFISRAAWHTDGLRWIGSLFTGAADALDRNRAPIELPLEPGPRYRPIDEFLYDVRFRMDSGMAQRNLLGDF